MNARENAFDQLTAVARLDSIIVANSIYPPESHQIELAEAELGDDLPYSTGQIWGACVVLAGVLLAVVFGAAWLGVQ